MSIRVLAILVLAVVVGMFIEIWHRIWSYRELLAYWLLGTSREEVRIQFRRVERELGNDVELKQVQALLHINPARKPSPYDVDDREENYFERMWSR